jgi:hypothetical protein
MHEMTFEEEQAMQRKQWESDFWREENKKTDCRCTWCKEIEEIENMIEVNGSYYHAQCFDDMTVELI